MFRRRILRVEDEALKIAEELRSEIDKAFLRDWLGPGEGGGNRRHDVLPVDDLIGWKSFISGATRETEK